MLAKIEPLSIKATTARLALPNCMGVRIQITQRYGRPWKPMESKFMKNDCWKIPRNLQTTTTSTFANYANHFKLRSSDAASLRGKEISTMCSEKWTKRWSKMKSTIHIEK